MDQIFETINKLIVDTYGGILLLWALLLKPFESLFIWIGRKVKEGANSDFIKNVMPYIEKIIDEKLQEIENKLELKLEDLKHSVETYKNKKHNLENDHSLMLRAILDKDEDSLELIRKFHEEKKH